MLRRNTVYLIIIGVALSILLFIGCSNTNPGTVLANGEYITNITVITDFTTNYTITTNNSGIATNYSYFTNYTYTTNYTYVTNTTYSTNYTNSYITNFSYSTNLTVVTNLSFSSNYSYFTNYNVITDEILTNLTVFTNGEDIVGVNGSMIITGMTNNCATISSPCSSAIGYTLYASLGNNSAGLTIAASNMSYNAGFYTVVATGQGSWTSGATVWVCILSNNVAVPQGTPGTSSSWGTFTYNNVVGVFTNTLIITNYNTISNITSIITNVTGVITNFAGFTTNTSVITNLAGVATNSFVSNIITNLNGVSTNENNVNTAISNILTNLINVQTNGLTNITYTNIEPDEYITQVTLIWSNN